MNDLKLVFSRDVAVATNFVGRIDRQSTHLTNSLDLSVRGEMQLLHLAGVQANKVPDSMDVG